MKWMKERDLLIAQTMAFVQSVTGKTLEAEKTVAAPVAPLSVETSEITPVATVLPQIELLLAKTPPAAAPPRDSSRDISREAATETPRQIPTPARPARLDLREEFQAEIRARLISALIRSDSPASARPIAARPWRRSTLRSGKANSRRGRSNSAPSPRA